MRCCIRSSFGTWTRNGRSSHMNYSRPWWRDSSGIPHGVGLSRSQDSYLGSEARSSAWCSCWLVKIAVVSASICSWLRSSCGWSSGRMCPSCWWLPSWRLPCPGKSWLRSEGWGVVLSTILVLCLSRSDLRWSGLWCCSEYMHHCRIGRSWQALWGYRENHRMFLLAVAYASWSFYVRQWRLSVPPHGSWVPQWWQLGHFPGLVSGPGCWRWWGCHGWSIGEEHRPVWLLLRQRVQIGFCRLSIGHSRQWNLILCPLPGQVWEGLLV